MVNHILEVVNMLGRAKIQGMTDGSKLFIYLPMRQAKQENFKKGGFVDFKIDYCKDIEPEPPQRRIRHGILIPSTNLEVFK